MKAAATATLVSRDVSAKKTAVKAGPIALSGTGSAGDGFSMILRLKAEAKSAGTAMRARLPAGTGSGPAAAAPRVQRHDASGETAPDGNALDALLKDAKTEAKRKASRARAPAGETAVRELPDSAAEPRKNASAAPTPKTADGTGDAAAANARPHARSEPRIYVLDLRKNAVDRAGDETASAAKISRAPADRELASSATARTAAAREPAPAAPAKQPLPPSASSSAAPLERLREMAGSELLKATGIILRDGGGEIRLVLKPESLGSVRIRMNLVDNALEGKIIVDTPAVKQVFDGSIDALMKALIAGGFQTASLEVSVGGQGADNGRAAQEPPAALRKETVQDFERNVPGIESVSLGDLLVNLFV